MRVLIVPASRHGGTAEMGRVMASALRARGLDVDVSQPEHMFDLTPYGAAIIGSGLYLGDWLGTARAFVDDHADALRRIPCWLFSSGPLGDAVPEEPIGEDVVDYLLDRTEAELHRLFGGRLELDRLSRTERYIARWAGAGDGDHRSLEDVEAWAHSIADTLLAQTSVSGGAGRDAEN